MNKINICFATDNNYAKYMGLALMSVLTSANKEDNLHFFILDNGIKQEEKDKINTLQTIKPFEITYIPINAGMLKNCHFKEGRITVTTYARFLVPQLINEDKLIYLDCDIFVRKSLAPLFNINIENYYMAGAADLAVKKSYLISRFGNRILPFRYLNAGVLLINNKKWKEENISSILLKYAAENSQTLKYADQDCLNYVLHSRVLKVGVTWNMYNHYYDPYLVYKAPNKEEILKEQKDPAIRHFKPWRKNNISEFRQEYIEMMKTSPWSEFTPKDDLSFFNILKIVLRYNKLHPFFFFTPRFYIRIKSNNFIKTIMGVLE